MCRTVHTRSTTTRREAPVLSWLQLRKVLAFGIFVGISYSTTYMGLPGMGIYSNSFATNAHSSPPVLRGTRWLPHSQHHISHPPPPILRSVVLSL